MALLIAEFRLLDEQLSALSAAAAAEAAAIRGAGSTAEPLAGHASGVMSSGSSSGGMSSMSDIDQELVERGAAYIDDSELARLAVEIPDLRIRLGIADNQVRDNGTRAAWWLAGRSVGQKDCT